MGLGASTTSTATTQKPYVSIKNGQIVYSVNLANDPSFVYSLQKLNSNGNWESLTSKNGLIEVNNGEALFQPYSLTPTQFILDQSLSHSIFLRLVINFGNGRYR